MPGLRVQGALALGELQSTHGGWRQMAARVTPRVRRGWERSGGLGEELVGVCVQADSVGLCFGSWCSEKRCVDCACPMPRAVGASGWLRGLSPRDPDHNDLQVYLTALL